MFIAFMEKKYSKKTSPHKRLVKTSKTYTLFSLKYLRHLTERS